MEFEELKKVWDSQNNKQLFVMDENALHSRILSKKNTVNHITNVSEWMLIFVNTGVGLFILGMNFFRETTSVYQYLMAAWMFATAIYMVASRTYRLRNNNHFDRSMLGDLKYAVSVATYQVRMSQLMRWNILPIGALSLFGIWEGGKSIWISVAIAIFFSIAFYASRWEHSIYIRKKLELETLQNKLEVN